MAKLTAAARKHLKPSQFAGLHDSYPIPDRSHAANAKARATQQWEAGKLSSGQREKIFARANAKLKRGR